MEWYQSYFATQVSQQENFKKDDRMECAFAINVDIPIHHVVYWSLAAHKDLIKDKKANGQKL